MINDTCILCGGDLICLYNTEEYKTSGYHHRCTKCQHRWFVTDLKNITGMRLMGKTDDYIREIIESTDKRDSR